MCDSLCLGHFESADGSEISEELASSYEFQHEVQIAVILSHSLHRGLKGVRWGEAG